MKKMNLKVLLAAVIVFAFCACSTNNVREPEQIGKQVFEILKNISSSSKDDYISNFLSIEEIRELGKNEDVVKDADTRNYLTSMLKEKWISRIEKDYNRIKEKGAKSGIIWNEIQYLDFVYELKDEDGIKGCEGELYFKFSDKSFKIEITSIFNGTEYRLVEIEDLGQYNVNTEVDRVISYKPTIEETTSGTFIDSRDGNEYNWVQIGDQVWMAENLKVTKYNDGTNIPNVTDATAWSSLTTGAYCNYNNDRSNVATYGRLYNWYAVNTGKLAPVGWHVPTDDDWTILENYLIANGYNYDGTTTENKIAKAMANSSGWESSSYEGTIGNNDYPGKQNASGFTALPGGYRDDFGGFRYIGDFGIWWSSTEYSAYYALVRTLFYNNYYLHKYGKSKVNGFSVRCVRD